MFSIHGGARALLFISLVPFLIIRGNRLFSFHFTGEDKVEQVFNFDIVLDRLTVFASRLVDEHNVHEDKQELLEVLESVIHNKVKSNFFTFFDAYLARKSSHSNDQWLDHSDSKSIGRNLKQLEFSEQTLGNIGCFRNTSLNNFSCGQDMTSSLSMLTVESCEEKLYFASGLLNGADYVNSQVSAFVALLTHFSFDNTAKYVKDTAYTSCISRLAAIVSETARELGHEDEQVFYAGVSILYRNDVPNRQVLQRLRGIVGISPVLNIQYDGNISEFDNVASGGSDTEFYPRRKRIIYNYLQHKRTLMIKELDMFRLHVEKDVDSQMTLMEIMNEVTATPFYLAHQGLNDRLFQVSLAKTYLAICPELGSFVAPHLSAPSSARSPTSAAQPMKIGFISAHFFDHSIGRMFFEMLFALQKFRNPALIEVYIFFLDDSHSDDMLTGAMEELYGVRYVRLSHNSVAQYRSAIAGYELDALVYADLGMELLSYLISFSRLATVQAAWWGHPITSGISSIDYFFGLDSEHISLSHQHYDEQLLRFEVMNTAPFSKVEGTSNQNALNFEQFGMQASSKYCLVLGRLFKIHPTFDEIVYRILLDTSVGRHPEFINRVKFVHFHHYTDLIISATVILDTFPYGGCLTSHDALSNAVPMVTYPTEHARGRYTYSMYRQMGHMDLVADSTSHYVQLVVELLHNDSFRQEQSDAIADGFAHKIHQNSQVAIEWTNFLYSSWQSLRK